MNDFVNVEKLLSVQELANVLGVHPWTIRHWFKAGKIVAYGTGRVIRFDLNKVLQSIEINANNDLVRYGSLKNRLRQKAPRK